jgi:putative pyruvate formate lyase activating enzyme
MIAFKSGLKLPIIYNTNGYDSQETLNLYKDIIDIYLPDLKYGNNDNGKIYSKVNSYFDFPKAAVKEMYRQVGNLHIDRKGIAKRGLLIRHLVLPDNLSGSEKVIDFIAGEISKDSYVNIMDQYHPAFKASENDKLNRRINSDEYEKVIAYAKQKGLHRGFF